MNTATTEFPGLTYREHSLPALGGSALRSLYGRLIGLR
jgi:hypothetical protein